MAKPNSKYSLSQWTIELWTGGTGGLTKPWTISFSDEAPARAEMLWLQKNLNSPHFRFNLWHRGVIQCTVVAAASSVPVLPLPDSSGVRHIPTSNKRRGFRLYDTPEALGL